MGWGQPQDTQRAPGEAVAAVAEQTVPEARGRAALRPGRGAGPEPLGRAGVLTCVYVSWMP